MPKVYDAEDALYDIVREKGLDKTIEIMADLCFFQADEFDKKAKTKLAREWEEAARILTEAQRLLGSLSWT
jgi:hypothetical protein